MTTIRFHQLKRNPLAAKEDEREMFARLLLWEKRSNAAKRAVETKRKKYAKWPTRSAMLRKKKGE